MKINFKESFNFQAAGDPLYERRRHLKHIPTAIFSLIGIALTSIEVTSYVILFRYVWRHDNKTANSVLDTKVINLRNRANAISLTGLFATWALELCYVVFGGVLSIVITDSNFIRELVSALIPFEYYFIPLVQVYSSVPIRNFKSKY